MELLSSWCSNGSLPKSYVLPPEARPGNLIVPLGKSIPVIDLQGNDRNETIRQILKAGKEFGFFQIINHGVPKDLMDETMKVAEEFHAMSGLDKERECLKDPNGSCKLYTSSYTYPREEFHLWRDALTHPCRPLDQQIQFWPENPTGYSNGKLNGAEHRVVTNSRDARTTVSFFVYPSDECLIGPAKALVNASNPAIYKPFKFADFYIASYVKPDKEALKELIYNSRVPGVGSTVVPLDGVANGRPPDPARQAVLPSRLERSATPVNVEDQQVVKRSRGESDEVMDIGVEAILGKQVGGVMPSDEGDVYQGTVVRANPSFRDMLMGGLSDGHKISLILDLDVDIQEEDVKFSMVNGTPAICFSDRVMEEANAKQQVDTSEKKSALPKDRFAVLASDVNEIEIREEELRLGEHGVSDAPSVEDEVGEGLVDIGNVQEDSMVARKVGGEENRVVLRGSGLKMLGIGSNKISTEDDQGVTDNVAVTDVVIQEPVTLNADAHTTVRIVERGADLAHKKGVGRRSASGLTEVAVKGIPHVGGTRGGGRVRNQVRRKQITCQPSRVGLDDWVGNMDRELEESGRSDEIPSVGDVDQILIAGDNVQWRENGSFDRNSKQ
ncbi:hypothetical protein V6N13_071554 [Hibiscus sabdariffa]